MNRFLFFLFIFIFSYPSLGAVPQNTFLEYQDGKVTFNYAGLTDLEGISTGTVDIRECSAPPDNNERCASNQLVRTETIASPFDFQIETSGLFRVSIKNKKKFGVFDRVVWVQFVSNLEKADTEIASIAAKHTPLYSFHEDEEYFPVSLSQIYDLPLQNYDEDGINISADYLRVEASVDLASEYIRYNGNAKHKITLKKEVAREIKGSEYNFPVYWYHEKASDVEMFITYIMFFGYDKKYEEYVNLASQGDHAVDRESITIRFTKNDQNEEWDADSVYYAGHLPNQDTTFIGCSEPSLCKRSGDRNEDFVTTWSGGKTRMLWSTVARFGERPIVYIAHGSHAHTPSFGFYFLDIPNTLGYLDVEEPSGNDKESSINETAALVEIDFSQREFSALALSGYGVEGPLDKWYRIHPFIRTPAEAWTQDAGVEFSDCVMSEKGCEDYIHRADDADGDGVSDERDDFPFDPVFQSDRDGDGVPDERDAFPDDSTETSDLNNDGFGDNAVPVPGLTRFRGIVVDQNGSPIPRALIRIESIQSEFARDGIIQTRTNSLGEFLINSDLSSLPNSFTISITAPQFIPDIFIIRKSNLGSGLEFVLQEAVLQNVDTNTVVIEPQPVLHHLGNDRFSDAINSQFQRSSEGVEYERSFTVTADQISRQTFTFNVFAKGVQTRGNYPTRFQFNGNDTVLLPQGDERGNYTGESIRLTVRSHLVEGRNTLKIVSGYLEEIDDFDDFEFINPVIVFNND